MTFEYCNHLGDLELDKKEVDGIRLYKLPNDEWVPSITSVTSHYNREVFLEWRRKVGDEEANRVTKEATTRGTDYHEAAQAYLENRDLVWENYLPATRYMFNSSKQHLDKIGKIHAIERTLYSEYLGLAGRVDCIAEYDGELAVIDFKTSKYIKPEKWVQQYFVQETAYACMYYELTKIPVKKLITIMVTPSGETHVYDKRNKGDYIKLLVKYVKEFVKDRMVVNG
jgi:genome maintenance exonuclease 1